jgi:geranylgeranyl reductase family protein
MIDVAVIGGGPAGLLAATRLARSGLDVILLEEHGEIGTPTHCTGIVSDEMGELAKIPESLVLGRPTVARLQGPDDARCEVPWNHAEREELLVIDRGAFDRSLAEQAVAAGAVLRTDAGADSVSVDEHGVTVEAGGDRVRAKLCLLACGVSYRFHRRLGLGLPGKLIHTAQIELDAEPSAAVELYFGRDLAPEGFIWAVPIVRDGRSRLKVGVLARGDAAGCLQRFLERPNIRARLAEPAPPPIRRLLPLKPITTSYTERVLVAGDAGGFTKPTTGGGIFYSLLTASLAADTLIEASAAERFDAPFLARYERRWRKRLADEIWVGDRLRRLITRCTDHDIDTLIAALARDDVQAVIHRVARFNWHRNLIRALLGQRGIASLLFRAVFR